MKVSILIAAILIICGFIFWKDIREIVTNGKTKVKSQRSDQLKGFNSGEVVIKEKWDLPEVLKEVSGIAYLDDQRFACVQDEDGIVFIYNRRDNKIEKQIAFGGSGDYEGITLKGNVAYVIRSNGRIFEIPLEGGDTNAKSYMTELTAQDDVEGICYDKNSDRLLLTIKNNESDAKDFKGIYAFKLNNYLFEEQPVFKIELNDKVLASNGKKNREFTPSSLGIHPVSGDFYLTDGANATLLMMDRSGQLKQLLKLGKEFNQAEGITFSPKGEIFISNEGNKSPGNIIRIELQE